MSTRKAIRWMLTLRIDNGKIPSHGLWSLWDIMVKFHLTNVLRSFDDLKEFLGRDDWSNLHRELGEMLGHLRETCSELELSEHLIRQIDHALSLWRGGANEQVMRPLVDALLGPLIRELVEPLFFMVPKEDAQDFFSPEPDRRQGAKQFSQAIKDLDEAGKCVALERYTASVFHSVRAVEYLLRALARHLSVELSDEQLTYASMRTIYRATKKKLDAVTDTERSHEREATMRFYSDAADRCLFFADLRNSVTHARTFYNDLEAINIFNKVHELLELFIGGFPA